ncbi:hypothetical protein RclHR1_14280003 [Rhizophagus clarus]|uniref:Pogo transposable element with KRAB domain-like n=1 Tax=Rhizophagus clarus TaxID=94130 RepID=A0A2Z6QGJ3_9GLOM|nr:hypothetical protein RclHR1_14280003 [Rhizophagus clarus]GES91407.1 pogo transposable element with KRAB domain-like [Rhizophagus clarus]
MPKALRNKQKRFSYSVYQKKQVITYAKLHGQNKAARHFDLNASMVGCWVMASKDWDSELNQNSKRIGSGRKAFYPEAEEKLYTWLIEQRKQGLAVTYTILRIKMQNILKEREMITLYGGSAKEFKTSCQWISSFMKRYKLS